MNHARPICRLLWAAAIVIVPTLLAFAADAPVETCLQAPSGLKAWWPADGNANDIIGGHNATVNGATFVAGKVGTALTFDGTDDYLSMGVGPSITGTGPFTVDAWVKTSDAEGVIIQQRDGGYDGEYILAVGGFSWCCVNGDPWAYSPGKVCWTTFGGGNWGFNFCSNASVNDGEWHHVAATREKDGTGKIYIDGAFDSAESASSTNLSSLGVFVGADTRDGDRFLAGLIDEVEIFDSALSATAITAIYTAGSEGKCRTCASAPPDLVSWWPGDGNAFDIAHHNDGTLQGNTTFAPSEMVGEGFSFDGSGDFVSVPDDASLDIATAITLDAWIKATTFALPPTSDTTDANIYVISKDTDAGRSYGLGVTDVDAAPTSGCGLGGAHAFMIAFTSGGVALACGATPLSVGVFYHLAGTYDSSTGTARVFVNGVLDGTAVVAPGSIIQSGPAELQIGARQYPGYRAFFSGLIDEAEVFDRALSADEIQAMVRADTAGKCRTCTPAPEGLVSWWPGEDDASDIADENDGVLLGDASFTNGKVDRAFAFDGNGDGVLVPDSPSLNFGVGADLSIDAWVMAATGNTVQVIVDKRYAPPPPNSAVGYALFLYDGRLGFQMADAPWAVGTYTNFLSIGPDLRDGRFHQVAVTVDRDSATGGKLYVDGVEVLTFDPTLEPGNLWDPLFPATLLIGKHQTAGYAGNFLGIVDEVEIFNRVLTPGDVRALFNAGNAGKCQSCSHGFWKNQAEAWGPTGFTDGLTLEDVFDVPDGLGLDGGTLSDALSYPGGKGVLGAARILLRQAVAALLNAAHPDLSYPRTVTQVIDAVNAALASNDRDKMLDLAEALDADNNLVCPLE